jgi:hypothetical protein
LNDFRFSDMQYRPDQECQSKQSVVFIARASLEPTSKQWCSGKGGIKAMFVDLTK